MLEVSMSMLAALCVAGLAFIMYATIKIGLGLYIVIRKLTELIKD